ncbi:Uncharacterised protein [Serratia fonticola]|uniref:hypothetical protein n=1 Tax=Serratia fonticola TaxID=47917 RepID=UPI002177F526|nr:hypothetical protein [Serratia fonticola]CAI1819434.1 Uncharacterised protein [Serratia fonticola]
MNIEITCNRVSSTPGIRSGEMRVNLMGAQIETPDEAAQREMLAVMDESVILAFIAERYSISEIEQQLKESQAETEIRWHGGQGQSPAITLSEFSGNFS